MKLFRIGALTDGSDFGMIFWALVFMMAFFLGLGLVTLTITGFLNWLSCSKEEFILILWLRLLPLEGAVWKDIPELKLLS